MSRRWTTSRWMLVGGPAATLTAISFIQSLDSVPPPRSVMALRAGGVALLVALGLAGAALQPVAFVAIAAVGLALLTLVEERLDVSAGQAAAAGDVVDADAGRA